MPSLKYNPLIRQIKFPGQAIGAERISKHIRAVMARLHLPSGFKPPKARAAGSTQAVKMGINIDDIVAQGIWPSPAMFSKFYRLSSNTRSNFTHRNKNPYFGLKDPQTIEIEQLWSSTLAGACTGGILAALARGCKAVPSGTIMFGVMALSGQWIWSKTNRYRQKKVLANIPQIEQSETYQTITASAAKATTGALRRRNAVGAGLLKVLPMLMNMKQSADRN
ncbi:hypothetical protein BCR41DRAFT_399361 [Lobosporangium transversale]|uniref:Uncharacterized protein n=1 Tax=Lobosporangium transversale TaxID=64571 RepID=A0A1Y2GE52_9FUNG|nr:hypothetical protein BCR41DRAFT_399361 [Lobosporangium transversale]ORZ08281.1 hypothetical protein BCR41DRAFT_399361 [Lobosporangium transversale]|eukprot:XP_021878364.1 hypothetical protein BCR41DRAFT_399361 [Lobosporangium transversale]